MLKGNMLREHYESLSDKELTDKLNDLKDKRKYDVPELCSLYSDQIIFIKKEMNKRNLAY